MSCLEVDNTMQKERCFAERVKPADRRVVGWRMVLSLTCWGGVVRRSIAASISAQRVYHLSS